MPEEDNVRPMWSEDELDRALAALGAVADPDDRSHVSSRRELVLAAGGQPQDEPPTYERRKRRWTWWAASVATVVAIVACALVVQTVQFGAHTPNAAAARLNEAADQVATRDDALGPGQYQYIATHAWWMSTTMHDDGSYSYLAENLLETWVPADQHDVWLWRRDVTGARQWVDGSEAEAKTYGDDVYAAGWPEGEWRAPCGDWFAEEEGREPCSERGSWQTPTPEFLAELPRDPEALHDRLRADTKGRGNDPDLEMLVYVADALRSGLIPEDVRASLYRVLGMVPSLEITEEMANLDGRKGTSFGISAAGERLDVIVDPASGQFIGERHITEDGFEGVPPGTVTEYTSVSTAVVDGMGVKPAG